MENDSGNYASTQTVSQTAGSAHNTIRMPTLFDTFYLMGDVLAMKDELMAFRQGYTLGPITQYASS